jgi:multisubunit Na+/H+ antiporter MnhG subunit
LLAALSLFCAGIAWIMDHAVFGSAFFALGAIGIFGVAERYWRFHQESIVVQTSSMNTMEFKSWDKLS